MLNNKDIADDICKKRVAFVPINVWDKLGLRNIGDYNGA
jgi:hypothetical protein